MGALPTTESFSRYTFLELNERGLFVEDGDEVPPIRTQTFLKARLWINPDITDVFVFVHGWRNTRSQAKNAAARLFAGIERLHTRHPSFYPALRKLNPYFVLVHWPSSSPPLLSGYRKIRDRAHAMTTNGTAEFVLASLLGYINDQRPPQAQRRTPGLLRAAGGFYVHCVGHSFGGRFLAQAMSAAAEPTLPTLILLPPNQKFAYTVDTFLVFQMAAPPDVFGKELSALVNDAPLQGPVCLTHTGMDTALCRWHRVSEGVQGIGCIGAQEPAAKIASTRLRPLDEPYVSSDFNRPIVNIDANWLYRNGAGPQGAHSDFWYEESIHLLLSLVNFSR